MKRRKRETSNLFALVPLWGEREEWERRKGMLRC